MAHTTANAQGRKLSVKALDTNTANTVLMLATSYDNQIFLHHLDQNIAAESSPRQPRYHSLREFLSPTSQPQKVIPHFLIAEVEQYKALLQESRQMVVMLEKTISDQDKKIESLEMKLQAQAQESDIKAAHHLAVVQAKDSQIRRAEQENRCLQNISDRAELETQKLKLTNQGLREQLKFRDSTAEFYAIHAL
ncbi:hypothetical protein TWF281_007859 [Arthrobotrys megalospora]